MRNPTANPVFILTISLFLFPLGYASRTIPTSKNPNLSAHKELQSWGFPIGLLPTEVRGYSLNRTTGEFTVDIGGLCQITLPPDNYLATYSPKVTGRLTQGKIEQLDGIRVRALFRWWSITGIKLNGGDLVFEVGMVSAKFPADNFDESKECEGKKSAW